MIAIAYHDMVLGGLPKIRLEWGKVEVEIIIV